MIEKILDNYYSKQETKIIMDLLFFWNIDKKVEKTKKKVKIKIKNKKLNEEQYQVIFEFNKDRALFVLLDYDNLKKEIDKRMEKYEKYVVKEIKGEVDGSI